MQRGGDLGGAGQGGVEGGGVGIGCRLALRDPRLTRPPGAATEEGAAGA